MFVGDYNKLVIKMTKQLHTFDCAYSVDDFLEDAHTLNIYVPREMQELDNTEFKKIINGVGPDYVPNFLINILNKRYIEFIVPSVLHDYLYYTASKHGHDKNYVDSLYYENCKKCCEFFAGKWWQIICYLWLRKDAYVLYKTVKEFGNSSWEFYKNKKL